jgi:hypothetical protein
MRVISRCGQLCRAVHGAHPPPCMQAIACGSSVCCYSFQSMLAPRGCIMQLDS